jgi:hypothetical protein
VHVRRQCRIGEIHSFRLVADQQTRAITAC